jgi:hypothetical protein
VEGKPNHLSVGTGKEPVKRIVLLSTLTLAGWIVAGCSTTKNAEQAKTYQCPSCKETVTWMYGHKGLPTGKKVTHECPACKREWGANLSMTSTCADCAAEHKQCPMCAKHQ